MNKIYNCSECNCQLSERDAIAIDGVYLCPSCAELFTVLCRDCGTRIWRTEAYDGDLCEHCYDNNYTICVGCERVIPYNEAYYTHSDEDTHENPYCERCYPDHENDEIIHDYYYKPSPIFYSLDKNNDVPTQQCMSSLQLSSEKNPYFIHRYTDDKCTNNLYLGVELEIDEGGEYTECAEKLLDIANYNNNHIYIKHDGSIDDGFEIVTYPMTLSYHKNIMPWHDVLIKAVRMGYVSHNTDTCGLHIHVNLSAFGSSKEEQETVTARLVYFFEKFWAEMLRFSRRTESQANRWASRYGGSICNCKQSLENAKKSRLGRYTAVNLCNKNTIEFRIFRGTLRYETFIATLEFIKFLCETAISAEDTIFHNMSWDTFIRKITEEEYLELISYLKNRHLYTEEPAKESEE